MSMHYEWTLSLRLRRDAPEAFLAELRYHLGLSDVAPQAPELDSSCQVLAAFGDGAELPGGPVTSLVRQQLTADTWAWGLFVRILVLDDDMYHLMLIVPPWLARWSWTEGWIGFAREENSLNPWLNFYASRGHAYVASPGEVPVPLSEQAPPFTARDTSESW